MISSSERGMSQNESVNKVKTKPVETKKNEVETEMVRFKLSDGTSILVKKSSVKVAKCYPRCPSSRAASLGYKYEGIYWIRAE